LEWIQWLWCVRRAAGFALGTALGVEVDTYTWRKNESDDLCFSYIPVELPILKFEVWIPGRLMEYPFNNCDF
jgi:hypothetical protein